MIVQGELLSRERYNLAEAEAVNRAEGNMCGAVTQGPDALPWSKTSSRTKGLRRNLGELAFDRRAQAGPRWEGDEP